jgi:potassium intermediate/small conductance calcium-activated channel subfamily N protein 2
MWLIMITMMTVGFGDYRPNTYPGRTICIIACFWGVLIVSMMVVTLTNATTLSKKETRAYAILHRLNLKESIRNSAAIVLSRLIKLKILRNHLKAS